MSFVRSDGMRGEGEGARTRTAAVPARFGRPGRATGRFSSTAWAISWGYWWRRLVGYLLFDLLLLACASVILIHGYNDQLPSGSFWGPLLLAPADGVSVTASMPNRANPADLRYVVTVPPAAARSFPLGADLLDLWPLAVVVGTVEALGLLGFFDEQRRVRRALAPLNDLALRAEELGRAGSLGGSQIQTLEQAIDRASVDEPRVSTGDQDLASIEVALNGLLRRMHEAKLQQMRFVNDASHELRTPIAVVQGYVNMLDRWGKSDPEVLDESIHALKQESAHMQELVEQLLFLARGDSGRNDLNLVRANLASLAREVWEESRMIDAEHEYSREFGDAACADASFEAVVDVAMVKQCLRILVQNARKYSSAGSCISLDVDVAGAGATGAGASSADATGAGHVAHGDGVLLRVRDEGIGMTQASATHVFDRFYRAENVRDSRQHGSGLGLSIAKWIVERHGGSIGLVSREGVGSCFTMYLPRQG
ncbi:sensor histidine kinase [Olsenella massiliensis]|uniref:sensor histidine kinase n=1 Tax=Olsenella massiliensis TaxID=1622075 RepID=UPI001F20986B|nr:HAMP domain-containing sensor histidine kinase [Olsenella massiliensis]